VIPFGTVGTVGTGPKLEHFGSLGVSEVVLRVRSGSADEILTQLDALMPLVALAETLA
jgi:hypothetical protein